MQSKHQRKKTIQKLLVYGTHIGALLPIVIYTYLFFTGNLGIDPVRESILKTGKTALILLLLTLGVTPVIYIFKLHIIQPLRRLFGLYTLGYAAVHLLLFLGLDYAFNLTLIWDALFEKRYAIVGLTAFLIMIPLAVTSSNKWIKRLGKNWKRLHKLVYLAGILVIIHFVWLTKQGVMEPWYFGLLLGTLLVLRIPSVKKFIQTITKNAGALLKKSKAESPPPGPSVHSETSTRV